MLDYLRYFRLRLFERRFQLIFRLFIITALVTFFSNLAAQPTIQSFSPTVAKAGDQVTISGSQFSPVAGSNIVYFGASKATVISAQSTSLVVNVPAGATYGLVSVTVAGLTTLSSLSFAPTFSGGPLNDNATFTNSQSLVNDYYPHNVAFADLDLDGRSDVIVMKYLPGNEAPSYLLPYRNASASEQSIDLAQQGLYLTGFVSNDMKIADFDGDGKLDVATTNVSDKEIAILRNISTTGQINFADRVLIPTSLALSFIATGDINGDGKIDIIGTNLLSGTVTILRNQSTAGNISFSVLTTISVGLSPFNLALTDLNGDNKPDLVIANKLINSFSIFPNTSVAGNFTFGTPSQISTPDNLEARDIAAGDLNQDGKNDLVFTTANNLETSGHIYSFRNTSSGGNISFINDGALPKPQPEVPGYAPSLGDVNGDGKVDIVAGDRRENNPVDIYQNQSYTSSAIVYVLSTSVNSISPNTISIGDLNGDGRPEMATSAILGNAALVYINRTGLVSISGINPETAGEGDTVAITGKNFTGASLVSFGGVTASSFSVITNTQIKAVVSTGASGNVAVTSPSGSDVWRGYQGFTYNNSPRIDSVSSTMGFAGDSITIRGNHLLHTTSILFGGMSVKWFLIINSSTIKIVPDPNSNGGWINLTTTSGQAYFTGPYIFLQKPKITSFTPASAYEGQVIAIFGQNLLTPGFTPKITIGGVPATFSVENGNQTIINVYVGPGASGIIKISHFGGSDSLPGFTFIPSPVITSFLPQSAKPADTVLIRGHNFLQANRVYFGDSAAAFFIVVNDSTVKAVVAHGKSGNIKIDKFSGTGSIPGFTFIPLGSPSIQSFSPLKAISGTTITISGQNLWGVLSIKVGNVLVKSFEQISPGLLRIIAPIDAAGQISVTTYYSTYTLPSPVFTRIQPPTILAFTPLSGTPGSLVTISGTGFGTNASAVSVYFGTIKAPINTIQDNAISVNVPGFVSLCSVTVIVNNLTAVSFQQFNPINPSIAYLDINENSFESVKESSLNYPVDGYNVYPLDLNGDNKPDFVTISAVGYIKYFKNTSTAGNAGWQPEGVAPNIYGVTNLHSGDIDGDGKTDLILSGPGPELYILRNVSTTDSIHFLKVFQNYSNDIRLADINSDGKLDMIRLDKTNYQLQFILNNSVSGFVAFSDTLNLQLDQQYENLILSQLLDINNDGLLDLVAFSNNLTLIFRNTGTKQIPVFSSTPTICKIQGQYNSEAYIPYSAVTADLNGDKLTDLIVVYAGGRFAIYKNISSQQNILFKPNQFTANEQSLGFSSFNIADFNADGKIDIATSYGNTFFLYQNASTIDSIILKTRIDVPSEKTVACVADIDGDNKQDFVSSTYPYFIKRNRMNEARSVNVCPNTTVILPANIQGSSFQWQMDTGTGFSDITDNANFSGTKNSNLTIINVPSSWLKRQFRCMINNSIKGEPYFLEYTNNWISNTSTSWNDPLNWSCGVVPDGNVAVFISLGKTVVVNQDGASRSLKIDQYVTFTIAPGIQLLITNK